MVETLEEEKKEKSTFVGKKSSAGKTERQRGRVKGKCRIHGNNFGAAKKEAAFLFLTLRTLVKFMALQKISIEVVEIYPHSCLEEIILDKPM